MDHLASGSTDTILLEDFGQKVDLTRRIREVLVNYPEGTTVLKELIQNADDAGATKVILCLDRRHHGVDSLFSNNLAQWQGPALLAYNDAVFTEEDFVSISRIGDSKKQDQTWKTGRFGVGFNSVYHLTDLPSFVSDKYAVLFDPHGSHLPNVSAANPGKRLDFVSSSAMSLYEDQFMPYCAFGCDMKNPFSGTLFRFPLRNVNQAAVSKLSKQVYTADDISSMFSELYEEAVFSLLFLKSIISIEMYTWDAGINKPQKLYSCTVKESNEKFTQNLRGFTRISSSINASNLHLDSYLINFFCEAISGSIPKRRMETFFIVQGRASTTSKLGAFAAMAANDYDLHLLPLASVALCLSDDLPEDHFLKQGHVFCSLPLPIRTGFNAHVNGYFEVYSNRRSIWFGSDMDRGGKLRSDWNKLLLEYVVAPAYCELLVGLSKLLGPTMQYYSSWPTGLFEEPWGILAENIYKMCFSAKVLFTKLEGGKWISPAETIFQDVGFLKMEILGEALVLLGMPVVYLPGNILDTMCKYLSNFSIKFICPGMVRNFIKESEKLGTLKKSYKLLLLEYCLTDLGTEDVGKYVEGLALLPLANGDFGTFTETTEGTNYFICNDLEYSLLGLIPDIMIDRTIPSDLLCSLSEIARSSKTNLAFLNEEYLLQLFPRLFPAEWRHENKVPWNPGVCTSHPTATWFALFWDYIHRQLYDISIFGEWPILPSTSGYLYRASKMSKFISAEKLSETVQEILVKIGCKILDPAYKINHRDLCHYVSDSDAGCILNSIIYSVTSDGNEICLLFKNLSAHQKNELRRFLLDPKWYHGGCISNIHIKNAKKLPIYRVFGEQHPENNLFYDLVSAARYLPPVGIPKYFLNGDFVFCSSIIEDEILLRYFGIERIPKPAFYRKYVLSRLGNLLSDVRDSMMLSILKELPQLCLDDPSLKESLRVLKFIPTDCGGLDCPESLYDPRVDELYVLLEESNCFPGGLFREHNVLDMLICLGLRTSVSTDTIIKSARFVESLMHEDQLNAYLHGKVLLSYLEIHANKWLYNGGSRNGVNMMVSKNYNFSSQDGLDKFWNDLRSISWCPVLNSAPHSALPWPLVSAMVAPPKIVRPKEDMWLVSASSRILDGECRSLALSSSLGWSSPPSGTVIAAQLLELGKGNELVIDHALRQELAISMPKLYSLLANLIGSDEMEIVKAILEGCRWIWVGDGFSTVNEVVLNGQLHLVPYIRVIPVDLAVFKDLFLELGVPEYLKPVDYANILCRMANKKSCIPLDAQELRATVSIAQYLAEIQSQQLHVKIYLPDILSRLIPAADLVYNDAPWFDSGENTSGDGSNVSLNSMNNIHNFVHKNISNDIAEKLGVRSLRRLFLAESSDSMYLSLSGVAEAFGQHEALTTRLKHIVEMYADGPGLLFELVQNAEDAQASEVVFLLDKTQYGTSSILSPQMAEWQGPALYCFNDSVFSSQDLYAISRIGQDSKLDKPAIGRFGLGFNCVYHFTDIPGFVSGENIVIFDPHASHLPGISPTHPGLRIKFVGRKILEQFPDQFMPFLHFGCDLQQPFPGTLFRFPLRNETAAHRSQIKKEKYSSEDVELLLSSFKEVVSESLLFLHNIQMVSIFIKDGSHHEMQLIHCVSRHSGSELAKVPHPHHSMLSFVHGNQQNRMDRDQFMDKLNKIAESDLPWNCQKTLLLEQSLSSLHLHDWIVGECIGGGRSKSKSLFAGNQSFKFIPWASVAVYLQSVNLQDLKSDDILHSKVASYARLVALGQNSAVHYRKNFIGRAFCFLPLPISTGLPTHINAYFELSSNRRDIWFGDDMAGGGKVRSEWNHCLLEDAIAPAYGRLLVLVGQEVGPCDLYFSFWPTSTDLEPWASMVRKFYAFLSVQGMLVLHTKAKGGKWISPRQAIFPDLTFSNVIELVEVLSEAGLPVANVSTEIVKRFMESCPSLHFLTPQFLRRLLSRHKYVFKNKDAIVTVLNYCLSDYNVTSSFVSLNGLPLIPLANGKFTSFNQRGEGDKVFVTSTEEFDLLVHSVPYLLADCSIPDNILKKLRDIANSEQTNLHVLTCFSLVKLLPRILPSQWQHAKHVLWTPGHHGQPSIEWMGLFWRYLKASCNDLSVFSTWPLLPMKNDFLLQLAENSFVIRDDGWSENMSSLLQKLGFSFLRSDILLDHSHLKNYVHDATAPGILDALYNSCQLKAIKNLFLNASKAEMRELRSFIFQSKWFSGNQIGSIQIDVIKHLPIFEFYKIEGMLTLTNPLKFLKPLDVDENLMDDNFILIESDLEKSILQNHLGIRELPKIEFYKKHIFHRMESFVVQPTILLAIFTDVKLLIEEDNSIKDALSEMPFVLAADGSWHHPSRLYDPRVPSLQNLLNKEAFFPNDVFSNSAILDFLTGFGLRRSLNLSGLIDVARSVSMLHECGHVDAPHYGRKLLSYLNALGIMLSSCSGHKFNDIKHPMLTMDEISHTELSELKIAEGGSYIFDQDVQSFLSSFVFDKQENEFWSEIRIIPWCPVHTTPLLAGLPWFASEKSVATPDSTRPKSQMWQVSSKMRILNGDCYSTYVQDMLGWMDPPDLETLSSQLVSLSKAYTKLKLQSDHELHIDSILQREMPRLYSMLQGYIDTDDFIFLREALDGISWLWLGDGFVPSKSVAFGSPVQYHPYLYAVTSELSEFRTLLLQLGVRLTFDAIDYLQVLKCLQQDVKGEPLLAEQLSFVQCVLEAFANSLADCQPADAPLNLLFIPNSSGILMNPSNLVYNDAPWIDINTTQKHLVHSDISNDLAKQLGVQSLRCLSLVDEKSSRKFSCMDYAKISDLLALYGESGFLLFDLLELADYSQAKKLHLVYDKRQHPRQSLLQHNLGDFQGSALTVMFEGATLSADEVCSLQLSPPWKIRGNNLNYGLGLIGSYFICEIITIVSGGYYFIFDPLGLVLTASSEGGPSAKAFTLIGNDLTERFPDQFSPLIMNQGFCSSTSDLTFIRMPLSSKALEENRFGCNRLMQIFDKFKQHGSSALLSLKSVYQVSISTWEEGKSIPLLDYSVSIDPAASIGRNPFLEKRWKKFQLSRIFSTSPDAIKIRELDAHIIHGDKSFVDKWLVVLSLGSGKTRNMALDRRYISYNLTPFAGVAAHICQNGQPISPPTSSFILSPLPLSEAINMPVTILGCFLISHISGRHLFSQPQGDVKIGQANAKDLLFEAWNKELLHCVRDSYVELVLELQKIKKDYRFSAITSNSARALSYILQAYGDRIYSFWPRSKIRSILFDDDADSATETIACKSSEEDWALLIDQVIKPFYARLVDMPVWQLYSGNVVKADEGMFLSQLNGISGDNLPPARVFSFIKEHYPVFSMPFELVKEIQAIGVKVKEITPKMVRNLLKTSVSVLPDSVEMYIEVLDYCLSDIHLPDLLAGELPVFNARTNSAGSLTTSDDLPSSAAAFISSMNAQRSHKDVFPSTSSSGGDALEIVTHFGMALYDFGRGVVEDMGKVAGPRSNVDTSDVYFYRYGSLASILAELKGLPFPTATTKCLGRLGVVELFIGSVEQQLLMHPFANKFVHALCLEKSFLVKILSAQSMHGVLKLRNFTPQLVSDHLRFLLTESWATHVLSIKQAPWVPWDKTKSSVSDGPHPDWIRLFWKVFRDIKGDLSLISDWPLVPAVLDVPILCRVKECQLIFIPPIMDPSSITFDGNDMICSLESMTEEPNKAYLSAFEMISSRYPWLMSLLCQLNIPVYDKSFLDSGASGYIIPIPGQSLGHVVASKLLAAKYAGTLTVPLFFPDEDRDRLFALFASDYNSTGDCLYDRGELDVLKELPIYKTVTGSYTMIHGSSQCLVSPTAFFQPTDERCLSHSADSNIFFHALGVNELTDKEVFTRFALPDFETKASEEMEDILLYLYVNWKDLQLDSTLVHSLKETNFVRSANELCNKLFKPRDLLDPYDPLLSSVFSGEKSKFAGERFATDGWLRILRMAGLCTSLHGNVIIECARKIELLGRQAMEESDLDNFENDLPLRRKDISLEIWSLAESVVVTIFSNLSSLFGNDFCEKISNIAFVPAEKGLPMIGGKKGGNRVLCRFREAILPRDWPLAWSTAPILTKLNVVPPEYSWGAFHLRSPPPFSTVLKHLQVVGNNNGEDTLSHWLHSPGMMTVEEASFEMLKYLDMNWSALSTSDKKELQKVPFIPVANGTRFIKVTSLFVRLTVRLSPFAFELPSVYLPFVKILSEIGVQEVLTVDHAKDLILNIQKTCGYRRLNPNEFRAVMEILHFICSNSNKSSPNSSDARIDNIVPDDGCKLVSASSCVYVDSYGSQFLSEIDTCRIRFCHPELPENMCLTLGIKKVSDVVTEELDEQQLQVVDQIGSIPLNRLKNKLLSKQFQHALWQLINGMKVHSPSFEGMDSELLERTLNQVAYNLQFVKLLYTGFLLLPKNINITRAVKHSAVIPDWDCSPRHRSIYFISKSRDKILVAEPPSFISIYDVVSIIVSQILEVPIILPIGSLLACPDGFENAMLTAMKLGSVAGFFSEGKSNMLVGMELLSQDALLVQFLPLRPFYKGEIVAWKPGNIGDKLRYGIVSEDIRPSADQAIHKIPLEIAPGKHQALLSTQVLSFKNISMENVASMLPENSEATSENVLLNVQENKDTDNGKIKQQTARELLHGKVSAEETVRAVHDMLLIAGINMDTEQQTLLQTTLTLQEQIRELQVDLLAEQVKAETASKEAEVAKAAWSCRVCLGSEVDTSIVPCGHVLCFKCCASVSRCPFCRGTVTKLQKIFRP